MRVCFSLSQQERKSTPFQIVVAHSHFQDGRRTERIITPTRRSHLRRYDYSDTRTYALASLLFQIQCTDMFAHFDPLYVLIRPDGMYQLVVVTPPPPLPNG